MIKTVQLRGGTRGYRPGAKFTTEDHGCWEQIGLEVDNRYFFRPTAELDADGDTGRLRITRMDNWVEVKRVG
jgi:hypothetical protein